SPAPSSAILFLSRRPPPRAPLFRYTTLFRSEGGRLDLDDLLVAVLPKEQIFDDLLQIGRRVPGRPTVVDAGERADRADVARDVLLAPGVPVHRTPAAVAVGDAPQHRAAAPTPCAGRLGDQRLNLVPLSPIEDRFPEHPGVTLFVPDDLAPVGAVAHEVLSLQHVLEGLPPPLAALGFPAHAYGVSVPRRHHALLVQVGGTVVQR